MYNTSSVVNIQIVVLICWCAGVQFKGWSCVVDCVIIVCHQKIHYVLYYKKTVLCLVSLCPEKGCKKGVGGNFLFTLTRIKIIINIMH